MDLSGARHLGIKIKYEAGEFLVAL